VYAELTSREVMTMEWVEGARLSDRAMLDTYGLEPSRLVDTMVRDFAAAVTAMSRRRSLIVTRVLVGLGLLIL